MAGSERELFASVAGQVSWRPMQGKAIVVAGASGGIRLESGRSLASRGARGIATLSRQAREDDGARRLWQLCGVAWA